MTNKNIKFGDIVVLALDKAPFPFVMELKLFETRPTFINHLKNKTLLNYRKKIMQHNTIL